MILVIVEGHSDRGFVEAVCRLVNAKCKVKVARGSKPEKVKGYIRSLAGNCSRVVVLIDEHQLSSEYLANFVSTIEAELKQLGVEGSVIVVSKSIESWILAGYCEKSAESIPDPLKRLEEKLGRIVVKSYYTYYNLALKLDLDHASKSSRGFMEFLRVIK